MTSDEVKIPYNDFKPKIKGGCPRGVMVKAGNRCKRVRTPVALLRSFSDKYSWEKVCISLSSQQ